MAHSSSISRSPVGKLVVGLIAAACVLSIAPARTDAYTPFAVVQTSSSTTYRAVPNKGFVDVSIALNVTNHTPDEVTTYACDEIGYDYYYGAYTIPKTCTHRTRYYINSTSLVLESQASNLTANTSAGKAKLHPQNVSLPDATNVYRSYEVTFPNLYRNQTRTIRIHYRIYGGSPRSGSLTRVNGAYLNFYGIAQPTDSATVDLVVPKGYSITTWGSNVHDASSGGAIRFTSGALHSSSTFLAGLTGTNLGGFVKSTVTAPSGHELIIEGWPGDRDWMDAVEREATNSLGSLEGLIGSDVPGTGPITLREVAGGDLGDAYIATYSPEARLASVSEDYLQAGTVTHELSHAWFNDSLFAEKWMSEGYASWAERAVGANTEPCGGTGWATRDATGEPDLSAWQYADPRATEAQLAAVASEYTASCAIVSETADKIGADRMRDVLAVLTGPAGAYPGTRDPRPDAPVTWREWLDAVDELGFGPAGLEWNQRESDVLQGYGIASASDLVGREDARAALEDLRRASAWRVPLAVYEPMATWDFPTAENAIAEIKGTIAAVADARALSGDVWTRSPFPARVAAATTVAELTAIHQSASDQLGVAMDVMAMLRRAEADQDLVGQLGLWGTDLSTPSRLAVDDVVSLDLADARAQIASVDAALAAAQSTGTTRLAVIVGTILVVLLLIVTALFVGLRRRGRGRAAAAHPVASADAGAQHSQEPTGTEQPTSS